MLSGKNKNASAGKLDIIRITGIVFLLKHLDSMAYIFYELKDNTYGATKVSDLRKINKYVKEIESIYRVENLLEIGTYDYVKRDKNGIGIFINNKVIRNYEQSTN